MGRPIGSLAKKPSVPKDVARGALHGRTARPGGRVRNLGISREEAEPHGPLLHVRFGCRLVFAGDDQLQPTRAEERRLMCRTRIPEAARLSPTQQYAVEVARPAELLGGLSNDANCQDTVDFRQGWFLHSRIGVV
jgi:hypothetical protein